LSDEVAVAARKVFGAFILTLFAYITIFGACQLQRRRGGPWALTFDLASNGIPALHIHQSRLLGDNSVTIWFPGERPERTDLPITAVFSEPITNRMPFGPIIFVDTTMLPGDLTLNAFGHVVEMIPRTLFVDFKEVPWTPGTNISLSQTAKPSPERIKAADQQWRGR